MNAKSHRIALMILFLALAMLSVVVAASPDSAVVPSKTVALITELPTRPQRLDLKANVGKLVLRGQTIAEAFDLLRAATRQRIFVYWGTLAQVKVLKTLPITTDLSNLPLDQAMTRLLSQIGGKIVQLGYAEDDGAIRVSTAADLSKEVSVRVYDVLRAIAGPNSRQKDIEAVVRLVRGIDPLSWKDAGGDVGSVRELQGQLIVCQTPEVQNRIFAELHNILPDGK